MIGSIQWKNHLLKLWFSLLKNSSLTVIKKLDWHAEVYRKKHLISQFLWDHIQAALSWAWLAWLRVSQSCNQSVSQSVFSTGGSAREKVCFQAHLACWQNSFPSVVGRRALAFCCHFSFWGCPQLLLATHSSLPRGLLHGSVQHGSLLLQGQQESESTSKAESYSAWPNHGSHVSSLVPYSG